MRSRFIGRLLAVILIAAAAALTSSCEGTTVGVGVSVGYPYGGYQGYGPWGPGTIYGGPIWR